MVLHAAVVEDVTAYLATPLYLLLARLNLRLRFETFLHGAVVELRLEESHGVVAVLELLAALGVLDEDFLLLARVGVGILIAEAYTRLHLVHVLTACSARAEEVPAYLRRVDIHLDGIVDERRHEHRSERRHALALCVERRHTHKTVHSVLALEKAVGVLAALYLHRDALDACLVALLKVAYRHLVAVSLCPAHVHTHEHLRPVLALGAAGARVYLHHAVHRVFLLAQHVLQLEVFDGGDSLRVVVVYLLFGYEFVFMELEGELQLVGELAHMGVALYPALQRLHLLHLLLGALRVFPEVGRLRAELFFFKFYFLLVDIKIALEGICTLKHILQLVGSDHLYFYN